MSNTRRATDVQHVQYIMVYGANTVSVAGCISMLFAEGGANSEISASRSRSAVPESAVVNYVLAQVQYNVQKRDTKQNNNKTVMYSNAVL